MNIFKRTILSAAIGLLTCSAALDTQAQFFGGLAGSTGVYPFAGTNWTSVNSVMTGAWTNSYTLPPGSSTNATFPLIDCYNNKNIAFQLSASGQTNSAVVTLALVRSTDGVLWETSPILLSATCATGAATTVNTNIDLGAFRFITAMAWTNTGGLSNAIVRYGIRPGF